MKILHLIGWYFPDSIGGTEVYVEGLCRRLRAAGHDLLIAAPNAHGPSDQYVHDSVPVFRYTIPAEPTRDEACGRVAVRGAQAFHTWMAEQRPDLLHVHSFTTGVGLPEIREARRLGIRVVATCHLPGLGYMCRTGELMQWGAVPCDGIVEPGKCAACNLARLGMPRPFARVAGAVPASAGAVLRRLPGPVGTTLGMTASVVHQAQMQRELFGLVDAFVVLNETARRMLLADGSPAGKIVVNRLGLSQTHVTAKPGPDARPSQAPVRFGYVGRLHSSKGLVELVQAARRLPLDMPFVLEIRGPQPDQATRDFVESLKAIAGTDGRIQFGGGVSPAEIPELLAGMDALVCPSTWFENGPTVALEANAVGTPVIGSRVGNLTEIVVDGVNGRLVSAGDVDAWARVLADAARDPLATIDVWRRGITAPRTMDDIARDYLDLYMAGAA